MTMTCSGLAKLIEECGELVQVCGKKLACYLSNDHWDGTDMKTRMEEEMGDVLAAIRFVRDKLGLDYGLIALRSETKFKLFTQWDQDPANNGNAVDGPLEPIATWISRLPDLPRDAPYWTNGMFVADCRSAVDNLRERP